MAGGSLRYKLTVAGGGGREVAGGTNLVVLVQKGRDLASRGYVACIKNKSGSIVELRRGDGDDVSVTYLQAMQDTTAVRGAEPSWVETIKTILGNTNN